MISKEITSLFQYVLKIQLPTELIARLLLAVSSSISRSVDPFLCTLIKVLDTRCPLAVSSLSIFHLQ